MDYSVFTMRTLYTLFTLISLILVALVAAVAAPTPTLNVNCTLDLSGVCTASTGVSFDGSGLNPHKDYELTATLDTDATQDFVDGVTVNSDRTFSALGEVFISPGTWTFTLSQLDHNGIPQPLLVETVIFE